MIIPKGNSKEELDQRKDIISQVYRQWTDANPGPIKKLSNTYWKPIASCQKWER